MIPGCSKRPIGSAGWKTAGWLQGKPGQDWGGQSPDEPHEGAPEPWHVDLPLASQNGPVNAARDGFGRGDQGGPWPSGEHRGIHPLRFDRDDGSRETRPQPLEEQRDRALRRPVDVIASASFVIIHRPQRSTLFPYTPLP